jgi:hypothetical protein
MISLRIPVFYHSIGDLYTLSLLSCFVYNFHRKILISILSIEFPWAFVLISEQNGLNDIVTFSNGDHKIRQVLIEDFSVSLFSDISQIYNHSNTVG